METTEGYRNLDPSFSISTTAKSVRLQRSIKRYSDIISPATTALRETQGAVDISSLRLQVQADSDDLPNASTSYAYNLTVGEGAGQATIQADTIYGAMYGMETFAQLNNPDLGRLTIETASVQDFPQY